MTTAFSNRSDNPTAAVDAPPKAPLPHRQGWRRPTPPGGMPWVNVSSAERWISAIAGGALLWNGLKMRSLPGAVLAFVGGAMVHRGMTGHCAAYSALGIHGAKGEGADPEEYFKDGIHVQERISINRSANELYAFWRNFENLPRIMGYLKGVETIDQRRSRWHALAPAGLQVSWEAEVIHDVPGETISWRSLYPATVDNAGSVRFIDGPEGHGAEVAVTFDCILPAGQVGWVIAKLFGKDPVAEVREDLRRFKAIMEAGEAPTNKGQPHGRRTLYGSLVARD